MKIIVEEWYSRQKCKDNPQNCYIFGENLNSSVTGYKEPGGGQSVIRGLPNTFGFNTKDTISDYWSDKDYNNNIVCIENDIRALIDLSKEYTLVFPKMGLGTGLSKLPSKAPKTFLYLSRRLLEIFGYNNIEFLTT